MKYGCGKRNVEFYTQGGRMILMKCGSTAPDGGVHQCRECEQKNPVSLSELREEAASNGEAWDDTDY